MGSVLVVDFRDSFVHTIVSYLRALGARVEVRRSDRTDVEEAVQLRPAAVLLSPGPGQAIPLLEDGSKDEDEP